MKRTQQLESSIQFLGDLAFHNILGAKIYHPAITDTGCSYSPGMGWMGQPYCLDALRTWYVAR